jgi:ribonucleotide monophosphatase NagD (HAD superfamily)
LEGLPILISNDGKNIKEIDSPGEVMMERERGVKHYLMDMDGVIYRGSQIIPGADRFVKRLKMLGRKFLFLTNSSESTPVELQRRLSAMGIEVEAEVTHKNQREKP